MSKLIFYTYASKKLPKMSQSYNSPSQEEGYPREVLVTTSNFFQVYYILYPIFLRNHFLSSISFSDSMPFDLKPSTIPSIALPCSVSTKIISMGLAVAQYMLTISDTSLSLGRIFNEMLTLLI